MREYLKDFKHLIWDFNGTLLDDAHLCVKAVNELLKGQNLPVIDVAKYQQVFDFPVSDYYIKLGFDYGMETFESLSERFHDIYHACLDEVLVFEETIEVIKNLSQTSHKTNYILSAAQQNDLVSMVDRFALKPYFKAIYGLEDRLARSKVERGLDLIHSEGINPADCLMIGDTTHDLEVGKAMGVEVLLVTGGHHHEDRLTREHHRIHRRGAPLTF